VINVGLPDLTTLLAKGHAGALCGGGTALVLAAIQGFLDTEARWTPWYWSEHGISYNSSSSPRTKAPRNWSDLCNPFFKGSVSFDPGEDRYLAGL